MASTHAIAWDHRGSPTATLEVPSQRGLLGIRHAPVWCGTSMVVDERPFAAAFTKRSFIDAGCGWVGAHRCVAWIGSPPIAGVHCFQRAVSADVREITFAWNNAETDGKTHPGAFYFRDLRFVFEAGWNELHLSRFEVDPNETQFFPALAQLTRRFVIYRGNNRDKAHEHLTNPPRPPVRAFGPSRVPLVPGVTLFEEQRVLEILASGKPAIPSEGVGELGFYSRALGVWLPHGDPKAYAHGGEDIFPVPRLGSPLWHQIRSDATAERQRAIALKPDGTPRQAHEWPSTFEYHCDRGSDRVMRLPPFQNAVGSSWTEKKYNAGTCAYEREIATRVGERGYSAYDAHHGCRAVLDALAHYYLTGCPLNRMRVQLAAQDYMTSFRTTQVGAETPSYPGEYIMHSLHRMQTDASRSPHGGGRIQREMAWIDWTAAQAIAITPPTDPMRARMQDWIRALHKYLRTVQLTNGTLYAGWKGGNSDDGIPWRLESLQENGWTGRVLEETEAELPVFQAGLLVAGIDEAGFATGDDVRDLIEPCVRFIYGRPDRWVRDQYNAKGVGPAWYTRVYANGKVDAEYTDGVGFSHTVHSRDSLARAYGRTADRRFLALACAVADPIALADGEEPRAALARTFTFSTDPWSATVKAVSTA